MAIIPTPQNDQQPQSVKDGLFTRIGRTFDSFVGKVFRTRNQQLIGPDGSKLDNPELMEKANLLGEKIYHAYVLGRLNFMQQTDGVSDETLAMRKEYWKWAVTEPALEAAIWAKLLKVLSNKLVIQPASKSPYDKAVAAWVKDCIIRSAGGIRKILEQVFYHGIVWGNVLCEPLWKVSESPEWKAMFPHGYYTLKDVTARDPADYRLEIDGHRNVIGVWTTKTNEWFPPSYFIRWANRPIYGNPAGTSGVRSSRRACMIIKAAQTYRSIYLEQFGLPMMKGKYNRNDAEGYDIANAAIQRARSMGYILLPDNVDLEAMQIATRGESEYQEAIEDNRKEVFLAQTGSYLFAMEGDTSDGAGNSETHKSTLDLSVWYLTSIAEELLNDQIIPWLVQLNCYNAALPRSSLGGVDDSDLKPTLEKYTGLYNLGLPLDVDEMYEVFNVAPPSSPEKALKKIDGQQQQLPMPSQGIGSMFSADAPAGVPLIQQTKNYTCGPVALQFALKQFNQDNGLTEDLIANELGSTPSGGTNPADLTRVARQYGLDALPARQMSIAEMREFCEAGKLVITPIQTGGSPESRISSQEGHYVVVKSVDNDSGLVGYFDPATSNQTEWVPINHFVSNWHDRDENGKLYSRFGIVLSSKEKQDKGYGFCPICGSPGIQRERRPNGDTLCENGHKCPSNSYQTSQSFSQFDAGPHKFACVMVIPDPNVDPNSWKQSFIRAAAGQIQDEIDVNDLADIGIEDDLHITVLYGCQDTDQQSVEASLSILPPFKITFGQLFVLTPDNKPGCEVLAVRVYGQGLEDLHYKLKSELAVETTYPDFTGHMTLAYLKAGTAQKYLSEPNLSLLLGEVGMVESVIFSQTDGERVQIDLGGVGLLPALDDDSLEDSPGDEFSAGDGITNPVNHEIAIAGPDGRNVAKLLRQAKQSGIDVLYDICQTAFARKFTPDGGGPLLFNDEERELLQMALQETISAASLLGQSAVWLRYMRDEEANSPDRHAEESPFSVFDASVKPLQPIQAIEYFKSLIPVLKVAPSFDLNMRRQSFTLAAATEKTLLRSIHDALVKHLVDGKANGTPDIQALLDRSGVTPRNPQYAEMVFRTNMMDAYTQSQSETMRDPQIQEAFPVWRYDGIDDGRQGEDHGPKFGKYFPSSASFAEVRGKRPFNCRCSPRPVHWSEWERLQEQGAKLEHIWE